MNNLYENKPDSKNISENSDNINQSSPYNNPNVNQYSGTPYNNQSQNGYNPNFNSSQQYIHNGVKKKSPVPMIVGICLVVVAFLSFAGYSVIKQFYKGYMSANGSREKTENDAYVSDDFDETEQGTLLARYNAYIESGKIETLSTELSETGFDVDYYNYEYRPLLHTAVRSKNYDAITMLIQEYNADPNLYDSDYTIWLPINYAVYNGDVKAINLLADLGADVEKREEYGDTPLMLSTSYGYKVVEALVELGADPTDIDDGGWGVAHYAAKSADVEIYEYLVGKGADEYLITDEGYSVAHMSLMSGDMVFVDYMMLRGFELTQPVSNGDTLLHLASSPEIAYYILENYDSDINAIGAYGWTPLHNAAYFNFDEVTLGMYLDRGAGESVNVKNNDGETSIFCGYNNYNVVKTLIDAGADLNIQNNKDQSVLMMCVEYENIVELLIKNGADITLTDNEGYTAYDYALDYEQYGYVTQKTIDMLNGTSKVNISEIKK